MRALDGFAGPQKEAGDCLPLLLDSLVLHLEIAFPPRHKPENNVKPADVFFGRAKEV